MSHMKGWFVSLVYMIRGRSTNSLQTECGCLEKYGKCPFWMVEAQVSQSMQNFQNKIDALLKWEAQNGTCVRGHHGRGEKGIIDSREKKKGVRGHSWAGMKNGERRKRGEHTLFAELLVQRSISWCLLSGVVWCHVMWVQTFISALMRKEGR